MSLFNFMKEKLFPSATSVEDTTETFQPTSSTSTTTKVADEEMETQTTKSQKSVSIILEDNHNKEEGTRKSPSRKQTVNSSSSTTSGTTVKKCSKSGGSTDWRLNLPGVVAKWEYLLENKLFADVTFLVGTTKEHIKCHSLVLKMQSRYFESLFASDKREFEVSNCSPKVFNKMLKVSYANFIKYFIKIITLFLV